MISGMGIKRLREIGVVVIEPFNELQLGPNSYDCTLGNYIFRYKNPEMRPFPKELSGGEELPPTTRVMRVGSQPVTDLFREEPEYYEDNHNILIEPHERILAHTKEFAGSKHKVVPQVACRSTIARIGLDVCASAGFGDVGFINRWTLEMFNFSSHPIAIPVGTRICQIFFNEITTIPGQKNDFTYNGSYNVTEEEWSPYEMLPKLPMKG